MLPWGSYMPDSTGNTSEIELLMQTHCHLLVRYAYNQYHRFPWIIKDHNLVSNSLWGTESIALFILRYTVSMGVNDS